jgi:sugar phosphate isomerase/epimerase
MTPISLQLYTLRELAKSDFAGVLRTVAEIGYAGVETAGLQGMKPADLRKVLDDLGLVCSSLHVPWPSRDNVAQRQEEAAALGTKLMISGLGPKDFADEQACKASVARLKGAAEVMAEAGLKFGYHNHWWEFDKVGGRRPYEMILQAAGGLFSELDVYWAANFGAVDVPAVIRACARRIPLLHVKDGPLVKGQPHTAVGAGKMNIPACVRAADAEVLQWLVVELDECATDMTRAVRDSYAYLVGQGLGEGRK